MDKCNTPNESGEPWNTEHWTETTVAAELLNKVSANSILGNTDLNTIRPYNRREMYIVWATCTNRPQNELFGYLTVSSSNGNYYCTQEFDGISGKKYSRYFEDSAWSEWEPFATATPPEDSDLPLSSGITKNYATYSIDQFGVVRVEIDLTKDGGFKNGEVIATLPVGVRPTKKLYRTITVTGSRPSQFVRAIVGIAIDTNGNISMLNTIDSNDVNVTNITGGFEFEVK